MSESLSTFLIRDLVRQFFVSNGLEVKKNSNSTNKTHILKRRIHINYQIMEGFK